MLTPEQQTRLNFYDWLLRRADAALAMYRDIAEAAAEADLRRNSDAG